MDTGQKAGERVGGFVVQEELGRVAARRETLAGHHDDAVLGARAPAARTPLGVPANTGGPSAVAASE